MRLQKIYIKSFRNLERSEIQFETRFNIFFGNNAQGKTNILEAIYLLATMKSFRMAKNTDLITWDSQFSHVKGWVEKDGISRDISVLIEKHGKKAKVDNKIVTRMTDFFGKLNVVVFTPEELNMVKGVPELRRRYLDRAVFTTDNTYLNLYHDYAKVLRNRNSLLKTNEQSGLEIWTEKLVEIGEKLVAKRQIFIEDLKQLLQHFYSVISGSDEEADLRYHPSHQQTTDQNASPYNLAKALALKETEERRRGATLAGPHRDDLEFLLNRKPLRNFASQGQVRSFILALKMAEIEYIRTRTEAPPILLLDDITSELDRNRNKNLMHFLQQRDVQVFVTTTDLKNILLDNMDTKMTFRVNSGRIANQRWQ